MGEIGRFKCLYCGHRVGTVELLRIHEQDCPMERLVRERWRKAIAKHSIRYNQLYGRMSEVKNGRKPTEGTHDKEEGSTGIEGQTRKSHP